MAAAQYQCLERRSLRRRLRSARHPVEQSRVYQEGSDACRSRPVHSRRVWFAHADRDDGPVDFSSLRVEPIRGGVLMAKINIDSALYDRAKQAAEATGYSSVDEFVVHCL